VTALADAARTAATWWRDLIALPRRAAEIHTFTKELPTMADQITQTLNEVAEGLRGPLATSITALIDSEAAARARVAELEGTETAQSTAANDVKVAFADVAARFAPVDEVPDVDPLPDAPVTDAPAGDAPTTELPEVPAGDTTADPETRQV
jgi:hypothetical protein